MPQFPAPSSALTRLCPHYPCPPPVARTGWFWPQGAVREQLWRRWLLRVPARLSIPLPCPCFLQHHTGAASKNTTPQCKGSCSSWRIGFFILRSPKCLCSQEEPISWRAAFHAFSVLIFIPFLKKTQTTAVSIQLELRHF